MERLSAFLSLLPLLALVANGIAINSDTFADGAKYDLDFVANLLKNRCFN